MSRPTRPQKPWTPPPIQSPQPIQAQVNPTSQQPIYPSDYTPENTYSQQMLYAQPPNYPQQPGPPLQSSQQQPMYYPPQSNVNNPPLNYQGQYPTQPSSQSQQPTQSGYFPNFQSSAAGQFGLQLGSEAFQQVSKNVNQNVNTFLFLI